MYKQSLLLALLMTPRMFHYSFVLRVVLQSLQMRSFEQKLKKTIFALFLKLVCLCLKLTHYLWFGLLLRDLHALSATILYFHNMIDRISVLVLLGFF